MATGYNMKEKKFHKHLMASHYSKFPINNDLNIRYHIRQLIVN